MGKSFKLGVVHSTQTQVTSSLGHFLVGGSKWHRARCLLEPLRLNLSRTRNLRRTSPFSFFCVDGMFKRCVVVRRARFTRWEQRKRGSCLKLCDKGNCPKNPASRGSCSSHALLWQLAGNTTRSGLGLGSVITATFREFAS